MNESNFKKSDNSSIMDEIKDFASKQNVNSLDELNSKLAEFIVQKNNEGIAQFLELSPTQMKAIIYQPFSLANPLFQLRGNDSAQLKEIPIIQHAFFFLDYLQKIGELKGTQLGNLPKNFVIEFYHVFLSDERYAKIPHREDDLFQLSRLRHLLELSGLIKKKNKKFSLTKKGRAILTDNNFKQLYEEIILTWANKLNWGFGDRYSDFPLIQHSAVFNFYILLKLANDWIEDEKLGACYLNAFPNLTFDSRSPYRSSEDEIIHCFSLRFLERFCLPLGLLEKREVGDFIDRKTFYRTTPFFRDHFKFSNNCK